jgi:RecB family exonuclease
VITPRATRLIRAVDLHAFHRAIVRCLPVEPAATRDCAVIVPTRSAAEELRRTIENLTLLPDSGPSALLPPQGGSHENRGAARALPDLVTRDEFYSRLRERMPGAPAPLTAFDREVLLRRSAHAAHTAGAEPPFNLRPGLVAEILALYDELRRRHKTVADFERLMTETLEGSAEFDRGAARLLAQTGFLTATFQAFERALSTVSGVDEHAIRTLALGSPRPLYRRVVVTVADQAADRRGLWAADFDLLTRMPFLDAIDVVATEALLDSGYYHRLHDSELPGIEDVRFEEPIAPPPVLVVPDLPPPRDGFGEAAREPAHQSSRAAAGAFVCRDREEELAEFARALKSARGRAPSLGRTAVVFQRPLPYLYLARQVFADAQIPYQALDSLPLAAEPFAAAVDLVFSAIAADFTRGALLELLRCPHLAFVVDGRVITPEDVHGLDRDLVDRKYLGGSDRLRDLAAAVARETPRAGCDGTGALEAAAQAATELSAARFASTSPAQIDGILGFITSRERRPAPSDAWFARHLRARAAVLAALQMLRNAHAAHDPAALSISELSGAVRRWIEGQTFSPRLGSTGVVLLDARAAPYADVDEMRIVGLTEADWPERSARSIFYPQSLLAPLGWPGDQDRFAAARAQFQDLLRLPRRRVSLSSFTLEDDAIVSPSSLLEDVAAAGLPIERLVGVPGAGRESRVFTHEALAIDPVVPGVLSGAPAEWLALRSSRSFEHARFRGHTGARAPSTYAVSRLERYLECPFKYFAAHVLKLPEERDEQAWMTPQERGHFVHEVFERFFTEWQRIGNGAITTANVAEALALFDTVAEQHLAELPEGDRALERTLLLGSAAAAGFGERAFAFEIEDGVPVVERLLEYELEDTFAFAAQGQTRRVTLRSKADRIDLLQDGTLRIVDYKTGRAPGKKRALQLPIYGVCAQQALDGRQGRSWTVSRAGYLAFKDKTAFTELQPLPKALAEGQARLLTVIDAVERGEFPVQPDEPFLCNWCAYSGVCRKDYVGDEIEK